MPKTVPGTVFFLEETDSIESTIIKRNRMFLAVSLYSSEKVSSFFVRNAFKRMSLVFGISEFYFYKNNRCIPFYNNIDFCFEKPIVLCEECITMGNKIPESNIFTVFTVLVIVSRIPHRELCYRYIINICLESCFHIYSRIVVIIEELYKLIFFYLFTSESYSFQSCLEHIEAFKISFFQHFGSLAIHAHSSH